MKRPAAALTTAAILALLAIAAAQARTYAGGGAGKHTKCAATIGVMGGFTGERASIGQEELHFARFAVQQFNTQRKASIRAVEGDIQVDPARASTVAQQFASNSKIVAIAGPDASFAVAAAGPILTRAGIAFISGSATRVSLTNGDYPTFFRVVPNDGVQGPTDARYMVQKLNAKKVVLLDNQTDYSLGLNDSAAAALTAAGVTVVRYTTSPEQIDYSSLVAKIGSDVNVVFLPLQVPANAQLLAQQLAEQGKHPTLFGADSVFSPADFHFEGAYVSSFAPDIHDIAADKALVRAFRAKYGDFATPFGPPVYAATNIILRAIGDLCTAHKQVTRAAVLAQIRKTRIPHFILGGTFTFDQHGEPASARFYVFKVVQGKYRLVG